MSRTLHSYRSAGENTLTDQSSALASDVSSEMQGGKDVHLMSDLDRWQG